LIVEGDLAWIDSSRRNHNVQIISRQGPSYFLKQGPSLDGNVSVAYEAAVYQFLQSAIGNGELRPYLPRFYGYDPNEQLLIVELLQDSKNLRQYHIGSGRFSTRLAATMGKALGALHHLTRGVEREQDGLFLSRLPPWILSIHQPDLGIFRNFSATSIQLTKMLQQLPEFCGFLNELRLEWRTATLIHHDIKWDNCVVFAPVNSGRTTRLKIVDWELASVGDPCWDVGSFFSEYLSGWLLSIPITDDVSPYQSVQFAHYPLLRMQPAMRAFWRSYVQRMQLDRGTSLQWLLRAVRYAAARLVQTAFEQMQMSVSMTSNVICMLQTSVNILQRPQAAAVHLLGIPSEV
jgi:hypothetical protein